jgi:phage terminase large subunit
VAQDTSTHKEVSFGYTPRPIQAFLHQTKRTRKLRFIVAVCHRRFGKTRYALGEIAADGFECEAHNPQYAYIAPTYGQAERVAWTYLKEMFRDYPGVEKNEAKLRLTIPRHDRGDKITIWLLGAENPDSIRGIYLDGIVLDEYAQCDPTIWGQVVRPALSDRKGWAIFIGTPKGTNNFYQMYQTAILNMHKSPELKWYAFNAPASKTGIIDPDELKAAKAEMSDEEYAQEFECSFQAALVGSYYGKYIDTIEKLGQIGEFPHDPNYPVETYWDIGVSDSTAIWFVQKRGEWHHIVDYYEMSGLGLEHYYDVLAKKGYTYADHYLPHDIVVTEFSSGNTRMKSFKSLFGKFPRVMKKTKIEDGINACRMIFRRCRFNLITTQRGLDALKNYERKWDAKNNIFQEKPLHNWTSHGADAFRGFSMSQRLGTDTKDRVLQRVADTEYNRWG